MARWKKVGRKYPKVLNCPHENTAMHTAAGFAMATGRGQAVMVHVDAGTANSAMAMHNARRGRLPLVLMAGKAPYTVRGELPGSRDNYVHFIQEPFDQSGIVRPYAKWEWTLPSGVMTKETLRRAHTVAHSDPMGPVYLMLPRETLTQTWDEAAMRAFPAERYGAVRSGAADAAAVAQIADKLVSAKHPVMVTSYAGRNLEAPALVEEIARFVGIRVFEAGPLYLNISRASPCFSGMAPAIAEADVGLLLDVDVPWIPKHTKERSEEHTSELQSHHDLVCRLLLEKKKMTPGGLGSGFSPPPPHSRPSPLRGPTVISGIAFSGLPVLMHETNVLSVSSSVARMTTTN